MKNHRWIEQLQDSKALGILVVDSERKNIFVNNTICKLFGYSKKTILANTAELFHINHNSYLRFGELAFNAAKSGTPLNIDYQFKRSDGSLFWANIFGNAIIKDEEILWIVVDITERVKAQEELNMQYEKLEQLTQNVPGLVFQYKVKKDGVAYFTYVSDAIQDVFELSKDEILNDPQTVFDLIHPDDLQMVMDSINKSISTLTDWHMIYRVLLPEKGLRWIEGFAKALKYDDGTLLWSGYTYDTTEKKETRLALEKERNYFQSVIDGVDEPIMVIKEDYTVDLMNSASRESVNDLNIADPKNPKCYEISHHRSTPCDGSEHPCPLKKVIETKKYTKVVHKHKTKAGEDCYVELLATPLLDKNKNCIGIIESARDITEYLNIQDELREQKSILDYQAHHDALTGLGNRVLFYDRLQHAITLAKRNNTKVALLFVDLDHFKEINDSFGHDAGDEVLNIATLRFKQTMRREDNISRLGGDEFVIIAENLTQTHDASRVAKSILDSLNEKISIHNHELFLSCSIGISIYPDNGENLQNLLKYADSAMYKAKNQGRSNFQYYSPEMTELAIERVVKETALRDAIKNEEFVVYYQPQVNGKTQEIIGMEALVHWKHPKMGLIPPNRFIPLAESTGLIIALDRFVMQTAMTQFAKWHQDGLQPGILAMNLAIQQLQEDDFISMFERLVHQTNCKFEWVEFEVTESHIMKNPEEAISILSQITDLGVGIGIDNFGTGFSSLAYLKKLPINKLKIDQAFIKDLPQDEEDAAITKAVIALAKSLNLNIVAEGVEMQKQQDFLLQNGCQNIQGYLYSRPVPALEMENILHSGSIMNSAPTL